MSPSIAYVESPTVVVPPRSGAAWTGLPMRWTGWNGDVFRLTSPSSGLFLMPGVRGLKSPAHTRHSSESPALPGSRHRGHRVLDRECFWPLYVYNDLGAREWMDWDRRFWATMDPDRAGTWTVTKPDGQERHLRVRFHAEEDTLEQDPMKFGWSKYAITLLADQPYWYGATLSRKFTTRPPKRHYAAEDPERPEGALLYISSSGDIATAQMTNPGDIPAYPVWTIAGPTTSVTVGVAGKSLTVPFEIPEGKAVRIDTSPSDGGQIAWFGDWVPVEGSPDAFELKNAVDRTKDLDPTSQFGQIPAGEGRQLDLSMTGTGSVFAEIVPRYRGAWR